MRYMINERSEERTGVGFGFVRGSPSGEYVVYHWKPSGSSSSKNGMLFGD
jgi:hypothetical protein